MDKAGVIERYRVLLNELDEPAQNVVLSSTSALVLLGVRETTDDLDAGIPENVFRLYERSNKFRVSPAAAGVEKLLKFDKDVELGVLNTDCGVVCVGGVWSYSPSALLTQKRYLSKVMERDESQRVADLADIDALEKLVKERQHVARIMA